MLNEVHFERYCKEFSLTQAIFTAAEFIEFTFFEYLVFVFIPFLSGHPGTMQRTCKCSKSPQELDFRSRIAGLL